MRAAYARRRVADRLGPVARATGADAVQPNVYDGGALVLYALRQEVGTPTFERLERAWAQAYAGRSASTADFVALASRVAHRDLRGFLTAWLYGTTIPADAGPPGLDPGTGPGAGRHVGRGGACRGRRRRPGRPPRPAPPLTHRRGRPGDSSGSRPRA